MRLLTGSTILQMHVTLVYDLKTTALSVKKLKKASDT